MKKVFIVLSLGLVMVSLYAINVMAEEQITLTTFYPAPYGIYGRMVVNNLGVGDNNSDGTVNINDVPNNNQGDVWINGNVGIGMTAPQAKLVVAQTDGNSALRIALDPAPDVYHLDIVPDSPSANNINYDFRVTDFQGNPDIPALTIAGQTGHVWLPNGNFGIGVGVGVTGVSYPLTVNGITNIHLTNGIFAPGSGPMGLAIGEATNNVWLQSYNSLPLALNPVGNNVGIGTSQPLDRLHVNGGTIRVSALAQAGANHAVYADVNGTLTNSASDIRLKTNVKTISKELDVLSGLKKLRGVYYNWDTKKERVKNFGTQREVGMIAQEVESVLPELVSEDKDGYKSLAYEKLGAFLVEVAKAQQKEIESLKSKNDALEAKYSELQMRMNKLEAQLKSRH